MSSKKQRCSFDFEGRTYTGYVVSSTDIEPHFHWFVFDDRNVVAQYGDSIPFKIEEGKLLPQYHLTSPDFVAAVQTCVQQFIDGLLEDSTKPMVEAQRG